MKSRRGKNPKLIHGVNSRRAGDWHEHIKATYVCFDCRTARKESRIYGYPDPAVKPKCHQCGGAMRGIGTVWRIPCRSQVKAWKRLQEIIKWMPKGRVILRRDRADRSVEKRPKGVRRQRFF